MGGEVSFTFDDDSVRIECEREVLTYRRTLTVDELNRVGEWLANRYNLKWRPIK